MCTYVIKKHLIYWTVVLEVVLVFLFIGEKIMYNVIMNEGWR